MLCMLCLVTSNTGRHVQCHRHRWCKWKVFTLWLSWCNLRSYQTSFVQNVCIMPFLFWNYYCLHLLGRIAIYSVCDFYVKRTVRTVCRVCHVSCCLLIGNKDCWMCRLYCIFLPIKKKCESLCGTDRLNR